MKKLIDLLKSWPTMYYYLAGGGLALGFIVSFSTVVMIKSTADGEFCTSCHTMDPMFAANKLDVHGGNNPQGFVAKCADCHLPNDSVIHYFWKKQWNGITDTFSFIFKDPSKIDWMHRGLTRIHDSSCLSCHKRLTDSPKMDSWKKDIHKTYFAKKDNNSNFRCVSCHPDVGHKELSRFLEEKYGKKYEEKVDYTLKK